MLPKLAHANLFLQHPTELPPNPTPENNPSDSHQPIDPEPWQTDFVDSAVLKQQRAIRQEINEMMHPDGEKPEGPAEEITVDPRKISKKMRKYQPANSSFSLFYGEKKQIEDRHARGPPRSPPIFPALTHRTHLPRIRPSPEPTSRNASKEGLGRAGSGDYLNYISKIKDIYREGCALRDKSEVLIHRIDLASNYLEKKYEKLGHQTEDMTGDVGTYHLEEETSKDYKKTLQPVPAYLLRK